MNLIERAMLERRVTILALVVDGVRWLDELRTRSGVNRSITKHLDWLETHHLITRRRVKLPHSVGVYMEVIPTPLADVRLKAWRELLDQTPIVTREAVYYRVHKLGMTAEEARTIPLQPRAGRNGLQRARNPQRDTSTDDEPWTPKPYIHPIRRAFLENRRCA